MKSRFLSYFFWVSATVFVGFFAAAGIFEVGKYALAETVSFAKESGSAVGRSPLGKIFSETSGAISTEAGKLSSIAISKAFLRVSLGGSTAGVAHIPEKGEALAVDLDKKKISLYQDGILIDEFPVLSIGKAGSAWETPSGDYSILTKEEKHFSSIGEVWMPWSMQFFGNFFIHGWPSYADGTAVPEGYSGGCIRLSTEDAEKVFNFVHKGTSVSVFRSNENVDEQPTLLSSRYFITTDGSGPTVSAEAYLVTDMEDGTVLFEKDKDTPRPIASLTKLMTALVSLEAVNQFQVAKVSKRAVETNGDAGELREGEKIATSALIFPLLLESSNDAAEVLAEHVGRAHFINQMNEKAKALSLSSMTFSDPSGISEENISNAVDLFRLVRYIYNDKSHLWGITNLADKTIPAIKGGYTHAWKNGNYYVKKEDQSYRGGKTGKTTAAGETFTAVFSLPLSEFEDRLIAVILLKSDNREKDTDTLVDFVKKHVYFGIYASAVAIAR